MSTSNTAGGKRLRTPRRRRNAVTMYEVAKHAGVSPMTVSRALSGGA